MKRKIKIQFAISLIVYTISYLFKTFILFEFTNPFEWILIVPKLSTEDRGALLIFLIQYYCISYGLITIYDELNEKK